ncbi:predicted MPP superfamily phosphohydrolase [Bacillus oleivorans]|uniref:Predicted MPP superfamily phosphohydrolase n=1 Tax=Bacillus oleivorans TaxID=1448271 RepID=A0A285CKN8_9BACI|nr:metallophosphoesterase [Bacillus oleivorans]SNX68114.1 predicted MPP superfamily phosphohydrolase [Bacillus oleivorans]
MLSFFIIVLVSAILLVLYMVREGFATRVKRHTLEFTDFPQGQQMRIFFISDIHKRNINDKLLALINEKVDAVVVGGDLTERGVPFHKVEKNIKELKKLGPVYFVWGNNDYEVDHKILDALLLHLGVTILDNRAVQLEFETGERVFMLGIDDMNGRKDRLDAALQDAETLGEGFRILVSHNPRILYKISEQDKIRLILSGHTHGGQIRLFGWGLYKKGRIFEKNGVIQLISNGYGTTKIPLRLGAKSETHIITLKQSE